MRSNAAKNMPMVRFAQRIAGYFNVRVRKLIEIGTINIIDITNNDSTAKTLS